MSGEGLGSPIPRRKIKMKRKSEKRWIKDIVEVKSTELKKGDKPVNEVHLTIWNENNSIERRTKLWTDEEYMENVSRGYYERMER